MMRQRKSSVPAASASAVETNNGYQRIHVSGITGALKASDLEQLFSKVCKVEEVYIPEPDCLGCSRGFAVVRVAEDKSKALQCIKNFNGSVWKGSKLRLAFAKEWYRERLDREKVEDQDKQEKLDLLAKEKDNKISQLMAKFKIPAWSSNMLRIRKARTLPKIKVCSQPKVILGTETYYSKAANAICKPYNKKIIFDDASFLEAVQAAAYIPEAEYKKKLIPKPTKASAETSKTTPVPSSAASKNNSTQNATSVVPASTLPKPAGGKGRQGFGTLLSVPLPKCIEEKVDCCIDDEEEERNRNSKNRRKNISEHDDFAENSFEIVYPNDDTPCMTAEELEDSVLQAERQRALNVALLLLQENETKDKQRKEPTPRAKPTAEDKAAKDKAKRADTNDSATKGSNATGEEQPSQEVINDIITQNPNAYVNISTFKNIFQKEEGVWWNDNEEKVSGSTHIRGKLSDDVLFQEAEKMGFDVRNSTGLSIFKAGTEAAAPAPEKTVMFNFFGEPDPVEEKPKVIETSMNTLDRKRKAVVLETKPEEKDIDLVMEDIIALAKRFVRERPLEEIENEWKSNKEELIQEFKKKRRDAKRWATQEKARRKNMASKRSSKREKK